MYHNTPKVEKSNRNAILFKLKACRKISKALLQRAKQQASGVKPGSPYRSAPLIGDVEILPSHSE